MQQPLAYIPSPSRGLIHLGPLPLRGYALMIILGVVVAVWLGERRWAARGGTAGTVVDIAVWAVPFGLVGGRLYHVITDYQLYFGKEWHVARVFEVWKGGLGIWGAIAAGTLGAYIACRRRGISLRTFADAAAPGIALAQALGRWGNWFNQELYGRPTKLPWAVKIDPGHRASITDPATYHPTFLYESLWCIGVAVLVIWAEKRFRLAYGRTFALYVAAYTVGRAWIEWLRVDSAHHILGLRLNDWTSLIVFLGAVAYLYYYRDRTEIPEGAVGQSTTGPEAEPSAAADEPSATAEEPTGTEKDSAAAAKEPADMAEESATDGKPAGTAGESVAEAAETEDAPKASGEEPETPGDGDGAPEATKPQATKPTVSGSADAGETAPTAETNGHAAPAESAEAGGNAAVAESAESGVGETGMTDEPGESGATGEAGGKDDGRARASTAAEPGERKS